MASPWMIGRLFDHNDILGHGKLYVSLFGIFAGIV